MAISFGGLATGLDTSSIIEQLMAVEQAPITRLETDKTWLSNKLNAYAEFDDKLNSFLENVSSLTDRQQYAETSVTQSSEEYFIAESSEDAQGGTSYSVEVVALAQRQKSYTDGFDSDTDATFGTGNLAITVDGVNHSIEITEDNNSLEGIMNAINDADIGIQANIINDGSDSPFRLTLTGDDIGKDFTVDSSGLSGGTATTLGTISTSQSAQQAHVIIDNIDVYSDNNEITDVIPGVTLNLLKAEEGQTSTVNIEEDNSAIEANINAFVTSYNEVVSFVTGQSTLGDTSAGLLGGDSGLSAIKRHLQDMLTQFVDTNGTYSSLAELGLETQKDGTVYLSTTKLSDAIKSDENSVINLLSGSENGESEGIINKFETYLEQLTDSKDGLYAGRKDSIESNITRINNNIEKAEARLEKREATLQSQFNAMEQLVSVMNSQSSFLTTQLASLENLWNYNS